MAWSSFPPAHKKSFLRGVAAYALIVAVAAGWVWWKSDETLTAWNARVPHTDASIKQVYVTPQITEAKPATAFDDKALPIAGEGGFVSLIMTDVGLSQTDTARALDDLPPEIALAFSPYGSNVQSWVTKAKKANHETLGLIPMEPLTYPKDDPGPLSLLTRQSDADNTRNLTTVLSSTDGAVGAMNFMGSSMMQDQKDMTSLLQTLKKRSQIFIENPQGPDSLAEDVAKSTGAAYLEADLLIDRNANEIDIQKQLIALEAIARKRGYAVGIAQPYPLTFNIIKTWADSLEHRGIKLVPLSAAWKAKVQHDQTAPEDSKQGSGGQPKEVNDGDENPPPLP